MELNGWTFAFEILNFIVLVLLLKHFLYRPVLNVIYERQNRINDQLKAATNKEHAALELKSSYEQRLSEWESDVQEMKRQLKEDIKQEKTVLLQQLHIELKETREKSALEDEQQRRDQQFQLEQHALDQATEFTTRLLRDLACPELQSRIIHLVLEKLPQTLHCASKPDSAGGESDIKTIFGISALNTNGNTLTAPTIKVLTAYALSDDQQQVITEHLQKQSKDSLNIRFNTASDLIAGIQINLGEWSIDATLANELNYFNQRT